MACADVFHEICVHLNQNYGYSGTADSKTGEEQSLRKVDEILIVDFNFLTVLRFL